MKVVVVFGSHRLGGTNREIEEMLKNFSARHELTFIHMADKKVESCTSCHQCGKTGHCVLPQTEHDHFQEIYDKMVCADAILIITPVYAGIPSRLTALFERLTSVLYDTGMMNTEQNPLLNKRVGIFNYCSSQICDESALKLIFDKFVMRGYRFDYSTYPYLNNCSCPNKTYGSIVDYVKDIMMNL
jgi:Multimeric flavodoxin WrbA